MARPGYTSSAAVMARRHAPLDDLDYFPTPAWATRALFEYVLKPRNLCPRMAWEPAAGGGHMVRALREYVPFVRASDIEDYGAGFEQRDFLAATGPRKTPIITNPPFSRALDFALKAHALQAPLVALFVRTAFLEGAERYNKLWSKHPEFILAPFSCRVGLTRDVAVRKVSSATSYAWVVWGRGVSGTSIVHIPPEARPRLERTHDYDADDPAAVLTCGECGEIFVPGPGVDPDEASVLAAHAGWAVGDTVLCQQCKEDRTC